MSTGAYHRNWDELAVDTSAQHEPVATSIPQLPRTPRPPALDVKSSPFLQLPLHTSSEDPRQYQPRSPLPWTEREVHCVVKLGGAVITHKEQHETLHPEALRELCRHIADCYKAGQRLVVIHGAGSFGHGTAKEFNVHKGLPHRHEKEQRCAVLLAAARTRHSVQKLNNAVIDCLLEQGVPAIGVSPGDVCESFNGEVYGERAAGVVSRTQRLLQDEWLPVLHGDVVCDSVCGCSILSGDTLCQLLCESLSPRRCVFFSKHAVFDRDPQDPEAHHIPLMRFDAAGDLVFPHQVHLDLREALSPPPFVVVKEDDTVASASYADVTGGMTAKLQAARSVVLSGCQVVIADGVSAAARACLQESVHDIHSAGHAASVTVLERAKRATPH